MNTQPNKAIALAAMKLLSKCTDDYASRIWETIGDDVISDVKECSELSDENGFTTGDIALAIGRVICKRIGIEI